MDPAEEAIKGAQEYGKKVALQTAHFHRDADLAPADLLSSFSIYMAPFNVKLERVIVLFSSAVTQNPTDNFTIQLRLNGVPIASVSNASSGYPSVAIVVADTLIGAGGILSVQTLKAGTGYALPNWTLILEASPA